MKDLFKHYQEQPADLKLICDKWLQKFDKDGLNYYECETFLNEVEKLGYTFEYGLDSEPFNLQKAEFYFKFIVPGFVESSYNSFEPAAKKAKKLNEKVFLCIYSENNIYGEVYDEEEITEISQIEPAKLALIKSFKKLTVNEDDLHQKARDLMQQLDIKYNRETKLSLDEYLREYTFTEDEKTVIQKLIEQF